MSVMLEMMLSMLGVAAGFAGLIWGADKFVLGASTTARNLGVSPLIIGMTIVALGTSAPEIFTSAVASLRGAPELAIGNAIGSNVANIGLVLGCTALIFPLTIPPSLARKELPALLLVTLACLVIFIDGRLDPLDGGILLAILAFFGWRVLRDKSHRLGPEELREEEEEVSGYLAPIPTWKAFAILLMGLILMIISSNVLVSGARQIAQALGVSDLVIGLTIVAIGTSLPELATSLTSAVKGHHDLAVGNIVGSNIMNILLVLPVPAFLAPVALDDRLLWRDYGTMALLTAAFALAIFLLGRKQRRIGRLTGAVFLLAYLAYTGLLFAGR